MRQTQNIRYKRL